MQKNGSQLFQFYYQNYVKQPTNYGNNDYSGGEGVTRTRRYQESVEFAGKKDHHHSTHAQRTNAYSAKKSENDLTQTTAQSDYNLNNFLGGNPSHTNTQSSNNEISIFTPYKKNPPALTHTNSAPSQNPLLNKPSSALHSNLQKRPPLLGIISAQPPLSYDVQTVYDLFSKTDKNPIALLHEYCSKIKKNVTYQFDVRNESGRIKREHYSCSIYIDRIGVVARGDGCSKKEAKNNAGEKALSMLINSDGRARCILGELLDRQACSTKKIENIQQIPGFVANKLQIKPQNMNLGQQQAYTQVSQHIGTTVAQRFDFPPPNAEKVNLMELLKNDNNF
jgi:K+/H+ antiporter YhaU regulatory subunit KhtT